MSPKNGRFLKFCFFGSRTVTGILALSCLLSSPASAQEVRRPVVSGQFYPSHAGMLKNQIQSFLSEASSVKQKGVRVLMVPHAGYVYSGAVAAHAYKTVQGERYDAVIILGFSHRTPLRGVFVDTAAAYETPLGQAPVDQSLANEIRNFHPVLRDQVRGSFPEHSVEVQVPFLQETLKDLKIVPIYMGSQDFKTCQILADAVLQTIRNQKVLLVVSTDLSHFHDGDTARQKDSYLISLIEKSDYKKMNADSKSGKCEACGMGPITTALLVREKLGWEKPRLLRYAHSGNITGDESRVVGYAALSIREGNGPLALRLPDFAAGRFAYAASLGQTDSSLTPDQKKALLRYVRSYLEAYFDKAPSEPELNIDSPVLDEKRGVFVTLKKRGHLRGCIGRITAFEPVRENLKHMAVSAALHDPRFPAVTRTELDSLEIHISLLTIPKPIPSYRDIRLGTDGIVVKHGLKSGVFLPEVATETGWDQETFFRHCALDKAGLHPRELNQAQILAFQTESFSEHDFR